MLDKAIENEKLSKLKENTCKYIDELNYFLGSDNRLDSNIAELDELSSAMLKVLIGAARRENGKVH